MSVQFPVSLCKHKPHVSLVVYHFYYKGKESHRFQVSQCASQYLMIKQSKINPPKNLIFSILNVEFFIILYSYLLDNNHKYFKILDKTNWCTMY